MTLYSNNLGLPAVSQIGIGINQGSLAVKAKRDPIGKDSRYPYGQMWINVVTDQLFVLVAVINGVADWLLLTGNAVDTLTGNTGGPIHPTLGNFNILGTGGINVAGSGSTLTISNSSTGLTWIDKSADFTATDDEAYFCNAALTATLEASPNQGSYFYCIVTTSSTVNITVPAGQFIQIGSGTSSSGGNAASTAVGDSLELYYQVLTSTWWSNSTSSTWILT